MARMNEKAKERVCRPKELTDFQKAERTICTMLLGEDNFYEDGQSTMDRLASYVPNLTEDECRKILMEAKVDNKLRHAPIFWANKMLKNGYLKSKDAELVTDRVDCVTDFLAAYYGDSSNKHGLPKQLVKGLQNSLNGFDRYQFSKYRGNDNAIKLRDAIRIVRPDPNKSKNEDQSQTYKDIVNGTLKMSEDTWEVGLSLCHTDDEKKAFWTRMLTEKNDKGFNKLGSLALLRNLRNMLSVGVSEDLIRGALEKASMKKILPFQIIGAARFAPQLSDVLETKLMESMKNYETLKGDTVFLVDVSGSMSSTISGKSELRRADAGAGVAAIVDAICERSTVYRFTQTLTPVNRAYHGFAMINDITDNVCGGTEVIRCTNSAIENFRKAHDGRFPDRVIVITDEADNSYYGGYGQPLMNLPKSCKGYVVNVGTYENGVNYNDSSWTRVSGWSDGIVKFISEKERKGL